MATSEKNSVNIRINYIVLQSAKEIGKQAPLVEASNTPKTKLYLNGS